LEQLICFSKSVFGAEEAASLVNALVRLPVDQNMATSSVEPSLHIIESRQQTLKNQRKALMAEDKALEMLKKAFACS